MGAAHILRSLQTALTNCLLLDAALPFRAHWANCLFCMYTVGSRLVLKSEMLSKPPKQTQRRESHTSANEEIGPILLLRLISGIQSQKRTSAARTSAVEWSIQSALPSLLTSCAKGLRAISISVSNHNVWFSYVKQALAGLSLRSSLQHELLGVWKQGPHYLSSVQHVPFRPVPHGGSRFCSTRNPKKGRKYVLHLLRTRGALLGYMNRHCSVSVEASGNLSNHPTVVQTQSSTGDAVANNCPVPCWTCAVENWSRSTTFTSWLHTSSTAAPGPYMPEPSKKAHASGRLLQESLRSIWPCTTDVESTFIARAGNMLLR